MLVPAAIGRHLAKWEKRMSISADSSPVDEAFESAQDQELALDNVVAMLTHARTVRGICATVG
jgi:hypothetical protein